MTEGFNWDDWTHTHTVDNSDEYYQHYENQQIIVNGMRRILNFNYWKFNDNKSAFDLWEDNEYVDTYSSYVEAYEAMNHPESHFTE